MNTDIIPHPEGTNGLALRIEDASIEVQKFFERKMMLASLEGTCGWCGKIGKLWKMHPGNVQHHNRRDDGLIVPMKMCFSCCERELTSPGGAELPEAESLFHPTDIASKRSRKNDVGHDGRPINEKELKLYIACNIIPRGSDIKDVSFVINDDSTQAGKKILRPEG